MDARDFLSIADRMRVGTMESEWRTSIGRSYYALFNAVIGALTARGAVFHETGNDHSDLINYLEKVRSRKAHGVSQVLRDLRLHRNKADYKLSAPVSVKDAEFVYWKAKNMIDAFDALPEAEATEIARQVQAIP